jgi:hypothetical protein
MVALPKQSMPSPPIEVPLTPSESNAVIILVGLGCRDRRAGCGNRELQDQYHADGEDHGQPGMPHQKLVVGLV